MSLYTDIRRMLDSSDSVKAPTHQENRDCFKRILGGCDESINEFIAINTRLAASAVAKFIQRHPASAYLIDDMFAGGLLCLTMATRSIVKRARQDPDKFWKTLGRNDGSGKFHVVMYIYISIYKKVQKIYEYDSIDSISDRCRQRFTPPHRDRPIKKVTVSDNTYEEIQYNPFQIMFFFESILDSCCNDEERDIIIKRLTMNDYEIAHELGYSHQKVSRIRYRIYQRFCLDNNYLE